MRNIRTGNIWLVTFLFILLSTQKSNAQINCTDPLNRCSENGYKIPIRGTVKVLFVFAEYTGCGYTNNYWPTGQLPPDKDTWLDYTVSANPTTVNTKYYKDISLGEFNVIGDYYNGVVQVPCGSSNTAVINKLNQDWQPNVNGDYVTAHGLNLNEFDNYGSIEGQYKAPGNPDGKIDALVIIWRNNPNYPAGCNGGLGVANNIGGTIKTKTINTYGSWSNCDGGDKTFFRVEFFHAMYGGNNFHTGGGAGESSFPISNFAHSYSTSAQPESVSDIVCGWDRWFLNYKGSRQYRISALNTSAQEVNTDLSISTHPNEEIYLLRDFVTAGDAIRIKLPHLNWTTNGDKKNQYLWIENHQKINVHDRNKANCQVWSKGLYSYIQVGKDVIASTGQALYSNPASHPNELNDHLLPLSAEGRYDFYYDYANKETNNGEDCIWNNKHVPYGKKYPNNTIKPNPLTGNSDVSGMFESSGDNLINSADIWTRHFKKYTDLPGSPVDKISEWGDHQDAFNTTGRKINICSNPSAVPVYTHRASVSGNVYDSFENRTIPLNNLSIEILSTDYYNNGTNVYQVKVKWDDHTITDNVRWCGNIQLKNDLNDPIGILNGGTRTSKITLAENKKITLDQGTSATKKIGVLKNGNYVFADPTTLLLEANTVTTLKPSSQLIISDGSTLRVKNGSSLLMEQNSNITVDATSFLCIESIPNIQFTDLSASVSVNGEIYYGGVGPSSGSSLDFNNQILTTGVTYYDEITVSGNSTLPTTAFSGLKAKNFILLNPNTLLLPTSNYSFIGLIQKQDFINNCAGAGNFRHLTSETSSNNSSVDNDPYMDHHNYLEDDSENKNLIGQIYPNPAKGVFKLDLTGFDQVNVNYAIKNSLGHNLTSGILKGSYTHELNINDLNQGIYIILITIDGYSEHHKLLIAK